jgi:hypothetical protein
LPNSEYKKELRKLKKKFMQKTSSSKPLGTPHFSQTLEGCQCLDSNGIPKTLYCTEKEAHTVIEESKERLQYYPCPSEQGWHLSKL